MGQAARRKRQRREAIARGEDPDALDASRPRRPAPSQSPEQREAEYKREVLERFDPHAGVRNFLRHAAATNDEWAGIPMPLDNERLVIEPTYPHAKELMGMGGERRSPDDDGNDDPELEGAKVVNTFHSSIKGRDVIVIRLRDGRTTWGTATRVNHFGMDLGTLGCAEAWGVEQESNAVQLLATLLRHRQFKQYMLTGMFIETSKRSGVAYVFRRLRPTVALRTRGRKSKGLEVMCTLCLHPIAYYAGTWAGAMCPTDDVIAHLMLMRGDEAMFWRRANQHPAYRPESGL